MTLTLDQKLAALFEFALEPVCRTIQASAVSKVHKIIPRAWNCLPGDQIRLFDDSRMHTIVQPAWKGRHWLLDTGVIISKDAQLNIAPLSYDDWWQQMLEKTNGIRQ